MLFCTKCGAELMDDDLFCGNCGTRIKSDVMKSETTNFESNQVKQKVNRTNIDKDDISKNSKQAINILKLMIFKPISSIKGIVNEIDKKTTITLGVILAILQGGLSLWFFHQCISLADKKFSNIISEFSGTFSEGLFKTSSLLKLPYGQVFIHGLLLSLIIFGVFYLGTFILTTFIYKFNCSSLDLVKVSILSIIPILAAEFLFLLASYVSLAVAIVFLLFGLFVSFSTLLIGVKELINILDDKLSFCISIIFTVSLVCIIFAIWKFILMDVESIKNSMFSDFMK